MIFVQSESTAARRRFPVYLVDATDGITPETGEGSGQPQISKAGGAFANTSATLTAIGNGAYYVELTATELDTLGTIIVRYKSANTVEFSRAAVVIASDVHGTPAVDATKISGDSTAADNLEAAADGTGYNLGGGSVVAASVTATVNASVTQWNGSAVATPNTAGVPVVDIGYVDGDAVNTSTDPIAVNVTQIGGETVAISGTGDITFVGGTTAAYTTGAVGSVTGNVGGNVVGSVASVVAAVSADVVKWLGQDVTTPTYDGVPVIELGFINGEVVTTSGSGSVTFAAGSTVAYTTGAIGSITGVTFPTNFGSLSIDGSGYVTVVGGTVDYVANPVAVETLSGSAESTIAGIESNVTAVLADTSVIPTFPTNFSSLAITGGGAVTVGTLPSIPVGWITADGIASEAITSLKFANGAITDDAIDTAAFTTAKFDSAFLTASLIASDAITAEKIATDATQAIATTLLDLTAGVETNLTPRQAFRLWTSALVGKSSNDGKTFRDYNDSKARITATVDADGNRTAVTTDAT